MSSDIFREYDIRGVFNKDFDTDFAEMLGQAYATMIQRKTQLDHPVITIGNDARLSSPDIVKSLTHGLTKKGCKVLKLGLVTTPISYFSTFTVKDVVGSIMVTGSHNPPDYNGFKISVGKTTIHGSEIKELEKIILDKSFVADKDGSSENYDIFPSYYSRYKEEFGILRNIPFVVDCGNGAAGSVVRKLYESVGLKPYILFEEPDGNFPNHHPDPTVEKNLVQLAEKVKEVGALIGIGFDGDADRIGLVDHEGNMIYGDELLAFCARAVLKKNPGKKIIGDVKCSDRIFDYIEKHGGQPIMWKTGHSLIKDKVRKENAPFGGEMSGHIFFNDRNYGYDDAPYAGLRIIEILAEEGKNFRELLTLPKAYSTPEIRIDTTEIKKIKIVEEVKKAFENSSYGINLIDGIRISYEDGWALVRASNTQPVLVVRYESSSEEGLKRITKHIEDIIQPLL
ncbi:MAG: phosphomannomutase/phosphoglucomutase [Bdellovibrionaceae bacterium]|nr:phosphomannomutase/phosphoglucomutase [Pseudobdellovibrionaceae bacterium]